MQHRFKWLETETKYREARKSGHGEELRWLVNREVILDTETGEKITRSTLRHPGVAVIVPFLSEDRMLLMHQYRFAADEVLWELPAGTLEGREEKSRMVPTESPEECAARELREETGYEAGRLSKVCECYATPGSSDELIHLFFARDLERGEQSLDAGEIIHEIRPFSREEIKSMIANGEIRDAKTLVGLFFALYSSEFRKTV